MDTIRIIKSLCALHGTTLAALERELNYSNGSLSKAKILPSDRLYAIASYFGVTMEYLITGKGEEKNEDIPILLEYYELNEQGKELLLERASELKKLGYIKSNKSGMVSA